MTVATKGRPQVAAEAETVPRRCVGLLGQGHLIPQAASDRPAQAILLLRCKSASLGFAARGGCSCNGSSATSSGIRLTGTSNPPSSLQIRFARLCREGGNANVLRQRATSHPAALDALLLLCPIILNFVPFAYLSYTLTHQSASPKKQTAKNCGLPGGFASFHHFFLHLFQKRIGH